MQLLIFSTEYRDVSTETFTNLRYVRLLSY